MDADLERGGRRRPGDRVRAGPARRRGPRPRPRPGRARARRGGRDPRPLPGLRPSPASPYEPPFSYVTDFGPRGHTVLEADFVTAEDGTGLVHTAIAFGEDDFQLGERYGIKLQNPVLPDGTFEDRVTDFAGQVRQGRRPRDRRRARALRPAAARRGLRARLPALLALRDAAPLLREGELVHRDLARCARGCSPTTRRSAGTPSTSSTAGSANGSRTTSTGRSRATATGGRRCRSGSAAARAARSAPASARSPSCASGRSARCRTTSTAPTSTRSRCAARAAAARCAGSSR